MSKIIAIHSFRGGTGKSNITANIAALMAIEGRRVGVVDADVLSPGIHVIFGVNQEQVVHSLDDYLWGRCDMSEAVFDVTDSLIESPRGRLFFIPSSINPADIGRIMQEGYDVGLLNSGIRTLVKEFDLDVLLVDTHPGLVEETLLSIATCDRLVVVMRPDQQDYEGTSVTITVARKLKVPDISIIVNKVPSVFDHAEVRERVRTTYDCEVIAVLPHTEELMALASREIFTLRYPEHPVTQLYQQVVSRLLA